ncbi:hypothetical protein IMZ48_40055, partial [Candidatus Bathyarchaeota archaeon]|nr:hypothetical protein [Candidatus Bathyarchaeota archaeon]
MPAGETALLTYTCQKLQTMPKPPRIAQVLRTAADWPLWIQQVNSRLLALELGDCLSMNAAGELELSPPKL